MNAGQREAQKERAAIAAVSLVESGMTLGLGSGSTFRYALNALARRIASGELCDIRAVPSSGATAKLAQAKGIPLLPLTADLLLDLTIDGADELDGDHRMIKGGGGALLREKLIAEASARLAIAVDGSKIVKQLGKYPLPVEVLPFGWERQQVFLAELGAEVSLRQDSQNRPYLTDNGNYILDCHFGAIAEPQTLAAAIKARTGIIEHGLFIDLATDVFVASQAGVQSSQRRSKNAAQPFLTQC
ncbi:MAG: ribose-5-phosphate isomerase RpiA [Chloroflexi bacterium]|nr:ribose-5-phosphate isomerase RpiA [Chloroflexota bacterium]